MTREIKRGDVFYVFNESADEKAKCEQAGIRPAVVLQNDVGNHFSPTIIVAYISSKPKKRMPTHVHTVATPRPSIVMCEQIATISKERLREYVCHFSDSTMKEIDTALAVSLGLKN